MTRSRDWYRDVGDQHTMGKGVRSPAVMAADPKSCMTTCTACTTLTELWQVSGGNAPEGWHGGTGWSLPPASAAPVGRPLDGERSDKFSAPPTVSCGRKWSLQSYCTPSTAFRGGWRVNLSVASVPTERHPTQIHQPG